MKPRKFSVLMAEDNEDDVEAFKGALGQLAETIDLTVLPDGLEALRYLLRRGEYADVPVPDLVILDIAMPRADGFEVLSHMVSDPGLREVPKILLTGLCEEDRVQEGLTLGADAFLIKPVEPAVLKRALKIHLFGKTVGGRSTGTVPQYPKVLIVEDNEDDLVLMREALCGGRFSKNYMVARDGKEAMEYLKPKGERSLPLPDLILMDVNMPRMNGFDVLRKIKLDPALQDLPVVMFTTSTRDEDASRSYEEGACLFISKPARYEEFLMVVRGLARYFPFIAAGNGEAREGV